MNFAHDVFISYAHLDNKELIEGQRGWVANFHHALEIRVGQYLGKEADIWRDPKLHGNDVLSETVVAQVHSSAILVSVVSPRYVRSEWTRREVSEFLNAAGGTVTVGDKCRMFKVLKTPVPLEQHPSELQSLLGYEFFKVDPESGRPRELDEVFGLGAQREFWMKVDDVAQDVCRILQVIEAEKFEINLSPPAIAEPVFVAFTTGDITEQRDILYRDLQQHGYEVVPQRTLGLSLTEVETGVRQDLTRCRTSVHLIGSRYGLIPEDGTESIAEIQYRLAIEQSKASGLTRLVWVRPGTVAANERQAKFIERLRREVDSGTESDLLETAFEELRTTVQTRLKSSSERIRSGAASERVAPQLTHVYYLYDERDLEAIQPWEQFLFNSGPEVLHPIFDGDETEIREFHEENLRTCDAVLIHFGAANELWVRRKLREVQRSVTLGRSEPMRAVGILLAPPIRSDKQHFHTHEAMVIPQLEGFAPEPIAPFLSVATPERKGPLA